MRVVTDTNVLISGIFFGGPPAQILKAWHDGAVASGTKIIISGDSDLLTVSGYENVQVMAPREFADRYIG